MVHEIFSRVVILDEGRIVADGPAELILNDVDLLESHGLESPLEPVS
jgi:cobalt/nickel transport system ATP-binding protein